MIRHLLALTLLAVPSAAGASAPPAAGSPAPKLHTPETKARRSAEPDAPARRKPSSRQRGAEPGAQLPAGFVEMFVAGLVNTDRGAAVVLRDASERRILPIWIGNTEANAIQLRLEQKRFPRPLTHDLLDSVVRELGAEVTQIRVDQLEGDTYLGTVFLKTDERVVPLDARPSDAIALALGHRARILVAEGLLLGLGPLWNAPSSDGEGGQGASKARTL